MKIAITMHPASTPRLNGSIVDCMSAGKILVVEEEPQLRRVLTSMSRQAVWAPDRRESVDSLRVVINQLRRKIEAEPSTPDWLLTEPWVGYRLFLPPPDHNTVKQPRRSR